MTAQDCGSHRAARTASYHSDGSHAWCVRHLRGVTQTIAERWGLSQQSWCEQVQDAEAPGKLSSPQSRGLLQGGRYSMFCTQLFLRKCSQKLEKVHATPRVSGGKLVFAPPSVTATQFLWAFLISCPQKCYHRLESPRSCSVL